MTDTGGPRRVVVVVGLDDRNEQLLASTSHASHCEFVALFDADEVRGLDDFDFEGFVVEAGARLDRMEKRPDAICSYWDFPVAELVPVLAEQLGLLAPSLRSVVQLQHKLWSRIVQAEAVPEVTPAFCAVDPFDEAAGDAIPLDYPYWIKPVRSFRSHLAFHVRDEAERRHALERIRADIGRLADPYEAILGRIDLPDEIADVDGSWCIAEQRIGGRQCTVEGFVHRGAPDVYGIVDSVRAQNGISFRRYEYPSRLPRRVRERMREHTLAAISAMDYDNAPFNVEFFWDRRTDDIWLLEINARQSQSHADLFEQVDGVTNHEVMVALALGAQPQMPRGLGEYRAAAKWFIRAWRDGVVDRVPTDDELADLHRRFPTASVHIEVAEGDRLADLNDQGSYSFELATVDAAASSRRQLLDDHRALLAELPLTVGRP